ncbi:MAG TPA: hypothetical protein VF456_09885 [Vicinamibacterales bacterium]
MLIYSEETFRYFLTAERRRVERSGRCFVLLLLQLQSRHHSRPRIPRIVAARIFSELRLCVREIDFIGWYRDRRVAAAILVCSSERDELTMLVAAANRIGTTLRERLPAPVARRLSLRVLQVRPKQAPDTMTVSVPSMPSNRR